MLDFTLQKYKRLCLMLIEAGFIPHTVQACLESKVKSEKRVVLRHDVDRKPANALKMAKMEAELGIQSTYYFRYPYTFKPDLVRRICDLGHEIGYHYEVLAKTRGRYEEAIKLFNLELGEFRKICDVFTICMHGSPLSRYDNRDLWKCYDFKEFGIIGEGYLSFLEKDISYLSDTGRSWNSKNNVRDFLPGRGSAGPTGSTKSLIEWIKDKNTGDLYLVTHPERWDPNLTGWATSGLKDYIFNFAKKIWVRIS